MSKILSVRVIIPGQWRDVWLYKKTIFFWNRTGKLSYLAMEDARKHITKNYGVSISILVQTLIFRNDWKVGEQSRLMLAVPEIEAAFTKPFKDREQITIEIPQSLFTESGSESYSGPVLDTCIYANRLYLATIDGLLESYINPDKPARSYGLDRQLDHRVSKLAVQYAAINAAAEEEGLFFGRVLFASEREEHSFVQSSFHRVGEYSLAVSYAARNLLNYTGDAIPNLYRARVENKPPSGGTRYEQHQVVGYHSASDITSLTEATLVENENVAGRRVDEVDIEVLGNSNYHLLAAVNGRLKVLNLRAFENKDVEIMMNRKFRLAERVAVDISDVLETYPISNGFIIELPGSVRLMNKDGSFEILKGESARIRTFVHSLRHKESIAVVQEDSASLIGFHTATDALF